MDKTQKLRQLVANATNVKTSYSSAGNSFETKKGFNISIKDKEFNSENSISFNSRDEAIDIIHDVTLIDKAKISTILTEHGAKEGNTLNIEFIVS